MIPKMSFKLNHCIYLNLAEWFKVSLQSKVYLFNSVRNQQLNDYLPKVLFYCMFPPNAQRLHKKAPARKYFIFQRCAPVKFPQTVLNCEEFPRRANPLTKYEEFWHRRRRRPSGSERAHSVAPTEKRITQSITSLWPGLGLLLLLLLLLVW